MRTQPQRKADAEQESGLTFQLDDEFLDPGCCRAAQAATAAQHMREPPQICALI